jgi:predicted ATPase
MATIWHGWALTETGQKEEGTAQIRNGLAAYQTIGIKLVRPRVAALLAEVYKKRGEIEEGLAVVFQGLEDANETEERVDESELHRLKGELLLAQEIKNQKSKGKNQKSKVETSPQSLPLNPQTEAEACFLKAIEISRQQQAKSLELRATMSLARLWQQQGRRHEARGMLSEVYNWFTEGFDTKDLQEAQALLAELSH